MRNNDYLRSCVHWQVLTFDHYYLILLTHNYLNLFKIEQKYYSIRLVGSYWLVGYLNTVNESIHIIKQVKSYVSSHS